MTSEGMGMDRRVLAAEFAALVPGAEVVEFAAYGQSSVMWDDSAAGFGVVTVAEDGTSTLRLERAPAHVVRAALKALGEPGTCDARNGTYRCTRPVGHEGRYTESGWHDDAEAGCCWPVGMLAPRVGG